MELFLKEKFTIPLKKLVREHIGDDDSDDDDDYIRVFYENP